MAFTKPTAAQINFDVTNISDPLICLNYGQSGTPDDDVGIIIERGSSTNVALIWDESADTFALINTAETGSTAGDVTISSYADLKIGTLTATTLSGNATTATALATGRTIAMTGDVTWTSASFDGSGNVTATASIGSGVIVVADMAANSVDSAQYVDGSIDLAHMSANSVDSDQYVDASIDLAHMSANSVDSNQYVDGSIDTVHIADDAVTTAKLANAINTDIATGVTAGTVASAALPKAGGAMTGAITTNSTFDGVDIATRDAILTSTTTTAGAALPKAGGTITGNIVMSGSETVDGRDLSTDGTKLDGIEASSTADQTDAEIRAGVEAASDSNVFTDADHSKLNAVEASADVTDTTNVVAALTAGTNIAIAGNGTISSTDTNTTYSAGTGITLTGTTFAAGPIALTTVQVAANQSAQLALTTQEGDVVVRSDEKKSYMRNSGSAGNMADFTELQTPTDSVLSVNGQTGVVTAAHIAAAVEAASDSNTFTNADHTKLNAIEASATADQTNAEIVAAVEAGTDSNTFTNADHSKLNAIEASATADQSASEIKTLLENGINSVHYVDGSIDLVHMSANSIDSNQYVDGSIDTAHFAAGAVDATAMGANSVDSSELVDGSIDLAHMSANSVDSDQYVDASIDLAHMSANSVDSNQYVDGSIDLAHMSVNSVDSDQYVDSSIDTAHIADDQITLAKMAGLARGKIIYGDSSGNPTALAVGSSGQVLKSDGTDISWGTTTASTLTTGRTIGMTGDVVWTSASFDGSGNVTGNSTIQANSVDGTMIALGSDAAGDVMYYNGTNYVRLAKGSNNEVLTLASGVPSWETVGSTSLTDEQVQDIVGDMLTGNIETGITVTYQDGDGTIDFVIGTLNQDTTGLAATATALATARTIGGVSFDGSANINLPGVNAAGNQSTSGLAATATILATARNIGGVSFDGSANINLPGVNAAGNQNTSGLAATATALATARTIGGTSFDGSANIAVALAATATALASARTIGGVSFDGTANINLPGVNASGSQDTSGTAAIATTVTITDNESTNESNAIIFTAGGDIDGGNLGLESDGTLTYNPSTGKITATGFVGTLTGNVTGTVTGSSGSTTGNAATATALATARTIGGTSFDGTANIAVALSATTTALATGRTIGGVSFDGTANINLPGVNAVGNQNTTGSAATLTTGRTIGGTSFDGSANIAVALAATATALASARTIGGVSFDGTANINLPGVNASGSQDTSGTAAKVTVTDSTANTNFPVVFQDESNALLDDTGALRYNPSTGTLLVPNLTVAGTTTQVDTVTMQAANAVIFEGATADDFETTLTITDPTADRTITLPNATGTVALTSSDITGNAATATTLETARSIAMSGDVVWSVSFNGSGNVTAAGTIQSGAVETGMIADDAITAAKIADDVLNSEHYAAGSIDLEHMSVNSVDSDQYVDGSIDLAHMSANSVDSDQYVDASIDTAHIADDQITLAKMASGTDGQIITYDASGNPTTVGPGSNGQVLTSTGAGSPPAFEDVAASTGFTNSTITTCPGADGNYDLAEGSNQDGDETPFDAGATTDAFAVSLGPVYDSMEPIGSTTTIDYGDGEAYVGA